MPTEKRKGDSASHGPRPSAPGLDLPIAMSKVVLQAWTDVGNEAVRFVWDRLQQDLQTQQEMLACTSIEELQRVQADFFVAAQKQYAAEAARMLDMLGQATASGIVASNAARRYDDVPL